MGKQNTHLFPSNSPKDAHLTLLEQVLVGHWPKHVLSALLSHMIAKIPSTVTCQVLNCRFLAIIYVPLNFLHLLLFDKIIWLPATHFGMQQCRVSDFVQRLSLPDNTFATIPSFVFSISLQEWEASLRNVSRRVIVQSFGEDSRFCI